MVRPELKRVTLIAFTAVLSVLAVGTGPVGCDSTGPSDGPTFPGNSTGSDDRELFLSYETCGFYPTNPVWSPDCKRVAVESYPGNRIYIYDVVSGSVNEVPNTQLSPALLDWSPDGEWLAYQSTYDWKLYIIKPDGSENVVVYYGGMGSTGGSFSPDGRELVFGGLEGLTAADISDPNNITYRVIRESPNDGGSWSAYPKWSPGGEYIARVRSFNNDNPWLEDKESYVYATTPDGDPYEVILQDQPNWAMISLSGWSPDGRYLLLTITADSLIEKWAYEVKTGIYTQITYSPEKGLYGAGSGDWGDNGLIVFVSCMCDQHDPCFTLYTIDAPY
jgi:Tol biopolymer transport system component